MLNVAIIGVDFDIYRALLEHDIHHAWAGKVRLLHATKSPTGVSLDDVHVLLAPPNIAANIVDDCPNLVWLQSTWAGNLPLIKANARHYQLTGVKDIFAQQMSEYVLGYILYFSRNINGFIQSQQNALWNRPAYSTIAGKTLGILGLGNIGTGVAQVAKQLGMRVISLNAQSRPAIADACFASPQLLDFAGQCDYCLNLLPDTASSAGICEAAFFEALPPQCVFINAGRGSVIDTPQSLIDALAKQQIKAAVLDVFEQEPLPSEHPFWASPNLYITQHSAAESKPEAVYQLFQQNMQRFLKHEALLHLIDFDKGY